MWVLLSVILILAVLLNISVALKVSFVDGVLDYSVKYGFIRVFSKGKKKTDESSTDKKAEKKKRSENSDSLAFGGNRCSFGRYRLLGGIRQHR